MSKLGILVLVVLLLLLAVGVVFLVKNYDSLLVSPTPSNIGTETPVPTLAPIDDLIKVNAPLPNALIDITKPLLITGQARGNWYFEASFPVVLLDDYGNQLAVDSVMASGSWMTENFVPFNKQLNFAKPTTLGGELILKNDNPSGLAENDRQLVIPVKFDIPSTKVKIFIVDTVKDPGRLDCSKVFPIERTVAKTTAVARAALEELLRGLTDAEKASGLVTSINKGVKIKSLNISGGTATVDFNQMLQEKIGGSCNVATIRAQITETLKQFSTVKKVIISIDGKTEDILQP